MNSHLLPLFISYRSSGEKLIKYQATSSCVIMSAILMTTWFYKALILQGEIWCWPLLGFKGLKLWFLQLFFLKSYTQSSTLKSQMLAGFKRHFLQFRKMYWRRNAYDGQNVVKNSVRSLKISEIFVKRYSCSLSTLLSKFKFSSVPFMHLL